MTINEKDRETLINYRVERAKGAEADARFLIDNDKLHLAVNRIYYGAFYILSALALKHKFQTSSHQELIGWFNKKFVKEGLIDRKYGRFVHKVYDKRSNADYADYAEFDKEEVFTMFNEMKVFLKQIEELISSASAPGE